MIIHKFFSITKVIQINLLRTADHLYRHYTGLPFLSKSMITPQLYLGGQYYEQALHNINKIGLTAVVSMRERPIKKWKGFENIKTLHLPTKDLNAPSIESLQKGIEFITNEINAGGKVYVHCHYGEGRGPTMAIAYLMSTGLLLDDAIALVKTVRPFIRPTRPQIEVLRDLEKVLFKA
ncbi:hypothetical protein BH09PAT2_BH09PAT2_01050 [soil metagenome]